MTTDEDKDDWNVETWFYAGMRVGTKGKAYHVYYDTFDSEPRWFDAVPKIGAVVGGAYTVETQRHDDGKITARIEGAKYDPNHPAHADRPKWTLEHRAAQATKEANAAVKRLQRETTGAIGDLTMREVRALYQKATFMGRQGVATALLQYLDGGVQ